MPILGNFPSGGGGGTGGLTLAAVTDIQTLAAAGKDSQCVSERILLRFWPDRRCNLLLQVLSLHYAEFLYG